ncbi:glycoside hydrolase family 38 C-terminal domain-containing protein [Parafrigoribacterium mesophilum]|uniref:alpha-mannosidase n=1 Tax=Parafrigoribacterium mesophilum TaxID=433646 RepID=UPI0031FD5B26
MHGNSTPVLARARRFVAERLTSALYRERAPLALTVFTVPGEPVSFVEATRERFEPFEVGQKWGQPWGTVWFHAAGNIPLHWEQPRTSIQLVVDLGFTDGYPGFQAEGLVYTEDGTILKAIEPRNQRVPLRTPAGGAVQFYVEAASNPNVAGHFDFSSTLLGERDTAGTAPLYQLRRCELALLDVPVWELVQDFRTLTGLAGELAEQLPRRAEILVALERAMDAMDPDDVAGTAPLGRDLLAEVLSRPASASAHHLYAVGHAHIDSAWLWPVRETVRKVARTFSNVLELIQDTPGFVFAASSAQQYQWLKEFYPQLFARVKQQVAAGTFVPVGGMWVEADTNLPGGEALVRQFVEGRKFFREEFGIEPPEVWLPDSFGYSAALPQIIAGTGARWFLTQKLSWNETNRFPHHTFLWEGIDGTRVFTHFPPVDTYAAELSAAELARAERHYAEKGRANSSLVPFGWGDGGGGPTREMIAAAVRAENLEGSPTVELSTPAQFFEAAQREYEHPPVWSGELYLEFHRGSYTSQAATKRGNRRSEALLREAELWATTAAVRGLDAYPYQALSAAWRTVLLNQFHDILPGTSIAWVHREAESAYAAVAETLEEVIARSLRRLAGDGDTALAFNAGPYPLDGVPALAGSVAVARDGVTVTGSEGGFRLENEFVRVAVDGRGLITSIRDLVTDREIVPPGEAANLLQLFRDVPTTWDAWNIDEQYAHARTDLVDADSVMIAEDTTGRATVRVTRSFGSSLVVQEVGLSAGSTAVDIVTRVEWHEKQKLLKLAFPLDIHADRAASEIQFGHVFRPTHANTSWDQARFETVAHRWVHVGEAGYGVAVANDCTYGHDIARTTRPQGGTTTTVRLSLLRAPRYPDPSADQGVHTMAVSVRAGADIPDAIAEGYRLNLPVRQTTGAAAVAPLFRVGTPAVVIEAVKLAEDRSGDVIVRLYEAFGSHATAQVAAGFGYDSAIETDLLERAVATSNLLDRGDGVTVALRPFQIVTVRFRRGGTS